MKNLVILLVILIILLMMGLLAFSQNEVEDYKDPKIVDVPNLNQDL